MEIVLPPNYALTGLKALQVSESVWLVPCTVNTCANEYSPLVKPFNIENKQKTRHTWSVEEDDALVGIVQVRGPRNWNIIAKALNSALYGSMPIRQGKQCRERWFNHLSPSLKKASWRASEDVYILTTQLELGNRWSEIAKGLEGRTENSVKNRWKCMMKKARRLNPNSDIAETIETILAERRPLLDSNCDPTESDTEWSSGTRRKLSSLVEDDMGEFATDQVIGLQTEPSSHNLQPDKQLTEQSIDKAKAIAGFSQYADYAKSYCPHLGESPRDRDFSPSVFIRSPH